MSGDIGLEQPIIFYHKKMTEAKKIVLEQKGIKLAYLEKEMLEECKSTHELQERVKSKGRTVPHRSVLNGSVIIKK